LLKLSQTLVAPEVGGFVERILILGTVPIAADGVFAVEQIHGDAEVALAAEDAEDLLVAEREQRVGAVLLAQRDLFE
jgi:hypothetical protein